MSGTLAFVGGEAWGQGCDFDADLLERSKADTVLLITAAAAYEGPARVVDRARAWFAELGAGTEVLDVLQRSDARHPDVAKALGEARFIYLADGSPLHLRSVLKETPVWEALTHAWEGGAAVAGTGAGGMVLGEPMVDPRGGAFTVGLGLVTRLAVLPGATGEVAVEHRRTLDLADRGLPVVAIPPATALLREADGRWRAAGAQPDGVLVFVDGEPAGFEALPG